MLLVEHTGRAGRPQIVAASKGTGRRLYHYHGGFKVLVSTIYEMKRSKETVIGHRCVICGFIPNDAARAEQQQALEAMLLRGFKGRGRRKA